MAVSNSTGEITRLLHAHAGGDRGAIDQLVPLVYEQLRRIARRQLARDGRPQTLSTTSLVHEAYMQLADESGVAWQNRSHFFAICARAMRRILVDAARRRGAAKRGGSLPRLEVDPSLIGVDGQTELVLAVDQALGRLAGVEPRLERVVECRYFAGMSEEETAEALAVSLRTVQRDWMRARAWLQRELA